MTYPIPRDALDDRLGILGTSGSGKTYLTLGAVEILLDKMKARVVCVDPLGVMWGLRLMGDGKTESPFNVVVFGGKHGDLPLTEHAGALIGETVATMAESCILDLSELPTRAAERRFMLGFLEAIYRHTNPDKTDPYHLIVDEADRFAPQKPQPEDSKLLGLMEEVVRRGRVRGFIPWLITQRPAVLNKNVLSMVDGLVLLKLTSPQDRSQVMAWIEGQADKDEGKKILGALPTMQRGEGYVWIPGRDVLKRVQFPQKFTFDSSAAPKRGQKRRAIELKPLDVEALKSKLATVDAEIKSSDPKALKMEIQRLKTELAKKVVAPVAAPPDHSATREKIKAAKEEAFKRGFIKGHKVGIGSGEAALKYAYDHVEAWLKASKGELLGPFGEARNLMSAQDYAQTGTMEAELKLIDSENERAGRAVVHPKLAQEWREKSQYKHEAAPQRVNGSEEPLLIVPAKQRLLNALAWWESIGRHSAEKGVIAFLAGTTVKSSSFQNNVSALKTSGLIDYPQPGFVALTEAGRAIAEAPGARLDSAELQQAILAKLVPAQQRLLNAVLARAGEMSKDELAARAGTTLASSSFQNNVSRLRSLGLITYPRPGFVAPDEVLYV